MRAIKTVLSLAGSKRRVLPDVPEDVLVVRALRASTLPKLLPDDALLFEGLVQDIFPSISDEGEVG
jgi:dynein heavy chain